jgi:hypothetical protein
LPLYIGTPAANGNAKQALAGIYGGRNGSLKKGARYNCLQLAFSLIN